MSPLRAALVFVLAAGCSSSQPHAKATTAAEPAPRPPVAEPGLKTRPLGNATGTKQRAMANCPSAVPGARTEMSYTEDGVDLAITAPAHDAQHQIRQLGLQHARMSGPTGVGVHTGRHTGTGRIGYCPIVHALGTRVKIVHIAEGVRVQMRAEGPEAVTALQTMVYERVLRLPRGERVID
jgi:hypothetical protein